MPSYELDYKQPYERDDDSGSGIGDHSIQYANQKTKFTAKTDIRAEAAARLFLSEGSMIFNHHIDGDGKTYRRQFVKLMKEIEIR